MNAPVEPRTSALSSKEVSHVRSIEKSLVKRVVVTLALLAALLLRCGTVEAQFMAQLICDDGDGVVKAFFGLGESGVIPVSAAVANAIKAAIGVRFTELPITPETVHRALAESSSPRPNSMTAT
jgi:hypothetical protein